MKARAPWRWRWGRIIGFVLCCGAWALALRWSPFFSIPLSLWVAMQIHAGHTQPRSPTGSQKGPGDEEAGHSFDLVQDDPNHPNHWKVTHRE